jgi:hypothetical protein
VVCVLVGILMMATTPTLGNTRNWTSGKAYTLPQGRWEKGLFDYLRYGQTGRLEWATHPVLALVVPNVKVKIAYGTHKGWRLATRYAFHYPTPLLRILRREGIGGVIAPDPDIAEIPHILSFRGELLGTRALNELTDLTAKCGIGVALKTDALDGRTTIDIPAVFPRTAVYYEGYQLSLGLALDGALSRKWAYSAGANAFAIPGAEDSFAFELGGWLTWRKNGRFRVIFGYLLTYATYPYGSQWQLMPYPLAFGPGPRKLPIPIIDLQWAGQRKARR